MANYGAPDTAFVLLGGRNIVGDVTDISDSHEAVLEDVTALGDSDDEWAYVGINRSQMSLTGLYSDGGIVTALEVGTAQELMYGLEGNTIGKEFTGMDAVRANITRNSQRDQIHRLEASFRPAAGADRGLILANLTARSDAAETTAVDNSASSSNGAVGYLGVSALTLGGYTSVTVKIRDSADDVAYADLITFANVTTAPASERATVAGTVDRYVKTTTTFNGAGSGESVTFAVGMRRT